MLKNKKSIINIKLETKKEKQGVKVILFSISNLELIQY